MSAKNILIINGHPVPESFSAKLASIYEESAKQAGHEAEVVHLHELDFDPIRHAGNHDTTPLESCLIEVQKKITRANHLVFIYPTWWGGMPALLKGFFERTFVQDFAFRYVEGKSLPLKLLEGRSADVLTSMDAPCFYYRLFQGAPGDKMIKNAILNLCGITPVKFFRFDSIGKASEEKISNWIAKVETRAKSL